MRDSHEWRFLVFPFRRNYRIYWMIHHWIRRAHHKINPVRPVAGSTENPVENIDVGCEISHHLHPTSSSHHRRLKQRGTNKKGVPRFDQQTAKRLPFGCAQGKLFVVTPEGV